VTPTTDRRSELAGYLRRAHRAAHQEHVKHARACIAALDYPGGWCCALGHALDRAADELARELAVVEGREP
jgi:hypothetical protein